nr:MULTISPECIES: retropepsin-like aspartic protease [unclassified Marinobacterium]
MLTYGFNAYLEQRDNPNSQLSLANGTDQVRLIADQKGQYRAPGTINGYPVSFVVDTGATYVSLSDALANELSLPRQGKSFAITANGRVPVDLTQLEEVSLGGLSMGNVPAMIVPELDSQIVLLGMSFLKHLDLVQSDGKLELRVP